MEKQSFLKSLLFLDKMYMPKIVKVFYILSVIASIAGGIFLCFYVTPDPDISMISFDYGIISYVKHKIKIIIFIIAFSTGLYEHQVLGIALMILGPIVARMYAELLIIIFKINEQTSRLADMHNKANKPKNL